MKRFFSILTVFLLLVPSVSAAPTSYDTFNIPPTRLKTYINTSQTTGIKLNPPSRNGADVRWPAQSGGILFFQQGTREELIYFSRATIDSENVVTLTGSVVRDIPWNRGTSFTGQGDGKFFYPGAAVTFVVSAQTLNLKLDKDRPNTLTSSGAIKFSGSGSFRPPYYTSSTERDRQRPTPSRFEWACLDDTGQCAFYSGSQWVGVSGSGNVINASESGGGKVELATVAEQAARTAAGSDSPLVIQAKHLTASGSVHGVNNSYQYGRIPTLNSSGALPASLGGTGLVNPSSGSVLVPRGSGAMSVIRGANNGDILQWNNNSWASQPFATKCYYCNTAPSTSSGASMATEAFFDLSKTIATTDWVDGMKFRVTAAVTVVMDANDYADLKVKIGTTNLTTFRVYNANASSTRSVTGLLNYTVKVLSVGAGGTVYSFGDWSIQQGGTESYGSSDRLTGTGEYLVLGNYNAQSSTDQNPVTQTIDMTASQVLRMSVTYSTASANNLAQVQVFDVERLIP